MRTLIVDDEPLARRGILLRLRKFRDVEVVGECADGPAAVDSILQLAPDLVFLDVQMPGLDGFGVLRNLPRERLPGVIFLTAYEKHALRAFEIHALDYLLKPVSSARFADAVSRAHMLLDSASKAAMTDRLMAMLSQSSDKYASKFTVHTGSRIQIVVAEDVDWIGTAGDYVELHSNGRSHLLRETMTSLEQRLDPSKFLRIHRSRIVKSERILELRSIDNREFMVKLSDGSEHRSSRTYSDRLQRWLSPDR